MSHMTSSYSTPLLLKMQSISHWESHAHSRSRLGLPPAPALGQIYRSRSRASVPPPVLAIVPRRLSPVQSALAVPSPSPYCTSPGRKRCGFTITARLRTPCSRNRYYVGRDASRGESPLAPSCLYLSGRLAHTDAKPKKVAHNYKLPESSQNFVLGGFWGR